MILPNLIEEYIASVRSRGMRYRSQAVILRYFSRIIGPIDVLEISPEAVHAFLYRSKAVTSTWDQNYSTLKCLYRYAITREHVKSSPLPLIRPKSPDYAQPCIYSVQEIKSLLDASQVLDNKVGPKLGVFTVTTFRTLLLLLYGASTYHSMSMAFFRCCMIQLRRSAHRMRMYLPCRTAGRSTCLTSS
jgi:integrase/recombinase XerD